MAENQFKCSGDCLRCHPNQRQYCASQFTYNSMLMIEKKNDVRTLRSMGASDRQICRIFMFEGRMISLAGAVVGLLLGLLLCWLQQQYGFITMGQSEGSFIVEAYPVSVHPWDLALIFVTVILVGWAAVWYPVRYLSKNLL